VCVVLCYVVLCVKRLVDIRWIFMGLDLIINVRNTAEDRFFTIN
jgi:hypothetical protein